MVNFLGLSAVGHGRRLRGVNMGLGFNMIEDGLEQLGVPKLTSSVIEAIEVSVLFNPSEMGSSKSGVACERGVRLRV